VKIRPGMSATVDITTAHRDDVLSIPYSAVVMRSLNPDSLKPARTGDTTQPGSKVVSEVQAAENTEHDSLASNEDIERKEVKGVFVIKDAKVQFVQIETGVADQKNIEITSGLTKGDSVVSGPYRVLRTIKDGDMVKIQKQQRMEQDKNASD
jgi:HlyD family secretion protein